MLRQLAALLAAGALASGCELVVGTKDYVLVSADPTGDGLPSLAELGDGWNQLEPGGETTCARGDAYSFFVRPGTENRLVIEFEGGGACWSAASCDPASDMFEDIVETDIQSGSLTGIQDHDRADNPFKNWTHVLVPYCTGDLHMGNVVTSYGDFEIQHKGAVNGGAVMDWVYANVPSPERVVVTGCSGGGYGTMGWSPHIMQHYDGVPVVQLADCAAGVAVDGFLAVINGVWNANLVLPSFIPALADANLITLTLTDIYQANADYFPSQQFSQYNTQWDETQIEYYEDMGGDGADWSGMMNESMTSLAAGAENFSYFVAAGGEHCIITRDEMYTADTGGTAVLDWIENRISGSAVEDVHCDPSCGAAPE